MEMPDKIYIDRGLVYGEEIYPTDAEKYHHSRIVEALKAENEELKAKLDKAKKGLSLITWQNEETWSQETARTTLEEI